LIVRPIIGATCKNLVPEMIYTVRSGTLSLIQLNSTQHGRRSVLKVARVHFPSLKQWRTLASKISWGSGPSNPRRIDAYATQRVSCVERGVGVFHARWTGVCQLSWGRQLRRVDD